MDTEKFARSLFSRETFHLSKAEPLPSNSLGSSFSRDQGRFTEYGFHLLQDKLLQDEDAFYKFYRKFYVQSDAKDALSFDQTVRNMVLQNTMIRDP